MAEALALIGAMYAHEKQIRADAFTGEDKRADGDSLLAAGLTTESRDSGSRWWEALYAKRRASGRAGRVRAADALGLALWR